MFRMAPLINGVHNARIALSPQQQALDFQQASAHEGKEATVHDFLSLGGSKRSSSTVVPTAKATTRDLLHPLERSAKPLASGGGPCTLATEYSVGPQAGYALVNGTMDLPSIGRYKAIVEESMKGEIFQMIEVKHSYDVKGSTPRSKHSATEQRRRSKINDRFQMLRQLLPNADQKRDKASFLLEVIEYIQMLQEKVSKFEMAEHGRLQERNNTIPWDARKLRCRDSNTSSLVSTVPLEAKASPVSNGYAKNQLSPLRAACEDEGSDLGPVLALHNRLSQGDAACQSNYESKPLPRSLSSSQPFPVSALEKMCTPEVASEYADLQTTEASSSLKGNDKDDDCRQAPCGEGSKVDECRVDDQEPPSVHGGFISISSTYSQGLLDTLTRALQSSGLDLTRATISVQIDLGRRGGGVITSSSKMTTLDTGSPPQSQIKESEQSPDSEHINKRPKLEVDV